MHCDCDTGFETMLITYLNISCMKSSNLLYQSNRDINSGFLLPRWAITISSLGGRNLTSEFFVGGGHLSP